MPRVHAGRLDALPHGRPVLVERAGRRLALVRIGDAVRAVDDACPHAGGPLSEGRVVGETVVCPYHGWTWSLRDGACLAPTRNVCAVVYATSVDAGEIWVEVPEP